MVRALGQSLVQLVLGLVAAAVMGVITYVVLTNEAQYLLNSIGTTGAGH